MKYITQENNISKTTLEQEARTTTSVPYLTQCPTALILFQQLLFQIPKDTICTATHVSKT